MTKEFESVKEMCDFVFEQSKSTKVECAYEIGNNEDGETCLYEKVLVGKVVKNGDK